MTLDQTYENSQKLLDKARKIIPGGVNSPVRAFQGVGGTPPFMKKAEGAYIFDEDDNRYIDFVLSWGPAILGHANPGVVRAAQDAVARGSSFGAPTAAEVQIAEMLVARVPGLERVRLVNSGTEACMSAIRVARGVKERDKIIKFAGCYHGHADSFLIAAGSGAMTLGLPNSPGVTAGTAQDTLIADFNDIDSVQRLIEANPGQVAAVILEPVCGNTGCIPPQDGFLKKLRALCTQTDVALIIDEVMTGFRIARGGAAERYGVQADLYCFGKVIGAGFPMAAYGGTAEMMSQVAPDGPIYQAGTLSGNPVAVAAGIAALAQLDEAVYDQLEARGAQLEAGLARIIDAHGYPLSQHRVGSMFTLFFHPDLDAAKRGVRDHDDVKKCDTPRFNQFFHQMLNRGVYLAPSQFEAGFLSVMHTEELIDETLQKAEASLAEIY